MILLDAIGGSHLYGLADAESDVDRYLVEAGSRHGPDRYRHRQRSAEEDRIRVSLSGFLVRCDAGSHQALDAMFAPPEMCEIDRIADLRRGYRASSEAVRALVRVVRKFSRWEGDDRHSRKRRRHAVRIAFQINDLVATGRYAPRLPDDQLDVVRSAWGMGPEDVAALCRSICDVDLGQGSTPSAARLAARAADRGRMRTMTEQTFAPLIGERRTPDPLPDAVREQLGRRLLAGPAKTPKKA